MSPEIRFALKMARLMIVEGRRVYPGFHENRLGHFTVENLRFDDEPAWLCISADDGCIVYGDYQEDNGDVWEAGPYDIPWPTAAHERVSALARIDQLLAHGVPAVQPAAEQKGPSA